MFKKKKSDKQTAAGSAKIKKQNPKSDNQEEKLDKNKAAKELADRMRQVQLRMPIVKSRKKKVIKINLNQLISRSIIYLVILFLFLPSILSLFGLNQAREQISVSQMVRDVREDKVSEIEVLGQELRLAYQDGSQKVTKKEEGQQALEILFASDIDLAELDLAVRDASFGQLFWELVINFLPIILMFVFFMFIFKQAKGGQDGILGIGKSKAKVFIKGKQDISFKDVGGMDEAKQELEEIVDFLKNPKKYQKVGARTPKGVLLIGPAGTGKTLLARAVAGEANVQFLSIAGSEFMEMLVGVGASRVRDLFDTAKRLAPSIIFIDEIDAIGRARGRNSFSSHDEREQTLNQILVEMDGFTKNDNVIVMAATNRGDMLDPALVRPGRFDRRVQVNLPDLKERQFILKIHARNKTFSSDVSWDRVAKRTVGFSGADLENMLNEAAISTARENREKVNMEDIEEASMKVKYGPSKKRLQDELEKKMTAYHEAGHAVLTHVLPYTDPVHRISIVSRGQALGYTFTPPEKDKLQVLKSELLENLIVMFGGRAAEILVFNEQTAGASSDIAQATRIARAMVVRYGMSKLGPMFFGPEYADNDYNRVWGEPERPSDKFAQAVDEEILALITEAETRAYQLLEKYRTHLNKVAEALLEKETLDSDEFSKVMGMKKARR
ncbi:MAG: ATP-dependent zinc metalloprotease FtsH [Patescibacteria group bacterium]|jgi:cell division protease FtsH